MNTCSQKIDIRVTLVVVVVVLANVIVVVLNVVANYIVYCQSFAI